MARVFQKRGEYWIDFTDAEGIRHRKKIGGSKRVAREVLTNILDKVNRQEFLGYIESSPISFADFAKDWHAGLRVDMKPRSKEAFAGRLKHLLRYFKGSLRSINVEQVEKYVAMRAERASNQTINGEVDVLKMVLRRAVARKILGRNPLLDNQGRVLDGVRSLKLPPSATRTRYLSLEEINVLMSAAALTPCLKEFILVSLNTSARRNEVLSMTRTSIDWTNRLVRIMETKNGTPRTVHLNDTAYAALQALPRRLDGRLWPWTPDAVSMEFVRTVRRAGIADFRLHDLRHTYLSYCAMDGVDARTLQELAGHKDYRMTMRYAHLSNEHLRTARNRVNLGATPGTDVNTLMKA